MEIYNAKIRCINLASSQDRWRNTLAAYGPEVIRIDAIDGMRFSSGEWDRVNRPVWSEVPANVSLHFFEMFPTTFACNLSHMKMWEHFLESGEEWGVFLEDDTEPLEDLSTIKIPDDCNFYFLIGEDHPGFRLSLYPSGEVKFSRTLGAYLMSRKATVLALQSMDDHFFQADLQVPLRIFESMKNARIKVPQWEPLPRIKAYGPKKSLIGHSRLANISTFTRDGKKCWIPEMLQGTCYND